jgi:F-type H+-transporting ATPase subunit b
LGGIESLGINIPVLICQIFNITLLSVALYFLLFKKFLAKMEERKQKIQQGLENAERAQAQAAQAQAIYDERVEQAEREREAILTQAREEGERIKAEAAAQAREEAREEAKRTLAEERQAFEAEQQQALAALHGQIVDLVLAATRKLVEEELDEKAQRKLIDRVLADLGAPDEIQ